jgi:hypothetical protein
VRHGNLDVVPLTGGHHVVCFLEGPAQRFLQEDAGPMLGTVDDQLVVRIRPARTDAHDVRTFLPQHVPVVGVRMGDVQPLSGLGPAGFIFVRDGDQLDVVQSQPDGVDAVPVIPFARPADDGHPILLRHREPS